MPVTEQPSALVLTEPSAETACRDCPLRPLKLFHEPTGEELELVQSLKRRERRLGACESLIHEGQTAATLYTLLQGWAFRYKTLSDGRRQILSFLLAGDFIGVQQKMSTEDIQGSSAVNRPLVLPAATSIRGSVNGPRYGLEVCTKYPLCTSSRRSVA
jgi:CRP-like cAMP-binding protein